jgi:putative heme-binding domain-containing protein
LIADGGAEPESRRQALRALLRSQPPELVPLLFQLLGDAPLRREAIRGLAQYDHPDVSKKLLERISSFTVPEREEMIRTLSSRPSYAAALLTALRTKAIAADEVSAFHARQIRSFDNSALNAQLAELWGDVRVTAEDKRQLIDQLRDGLTAEHMAESDLSQGRELFQKNCANCHVLYGEGVKIGPDLTGSNRKNLDYLLENIVDPSASVGADFRTLIALLDDGRVINGVITATSERTLTLQTSQEAVTLDRNSIESMQQSNTSLMPDGLLQNLSSEQIRDLVGYLMSSSQVPLPPSSRSE